MLLDALQAEHNITPLGDPCLSKPITGYLCFHPITGYLCFSSNNRTSLFSFFWTTSLEKIIECRDEKSLGDYCKKHIDPFRNSQENWRVFYKLINQRLNRVARVVESVQRCQSDIAVITCFTDGTGGLLVDEALAGLLLCKFISDVTSIVNVIFVFIYDAISSVYLK